MKKIFIYLILCTSLISCEEVIQVDLEQSEPRLVVEASIIWFTGTAGTNQMITLTETTPFYEDEILPVANADVKIISEDGQEFIFEHQQDGIYLNTNFEPVLGNAYTLEILHDGNIYTAQENLQGVTNLDFIEQTQTGGFSGDEIEIKAYYTDPASEENFYLFKFEREESVNLEFYEDEFTNGNQIFGYYSNENISVNDVVEIEIQGISKRYYEYLFILRSQVGSNDGGPFETMPATVKGNIINLNNPDEYPFGYFRLSQADSTTYIVE